MIRPVHRAAALLAVVILAGCGLLDDVVEPEPRACTAIGCESAVRFVLDVDLVVGETYAVEACLETRCSGAELAVPPAADGPFSGIADGDLFLDADADAIVLTLAEGDYSGPHRARLTVRDDAGMPIAEIDVETELERNQPNGPGCEPICWFAEVSA